MANTRWKAQRRVIDFSCWPSFTPPTVWKKAKRDTERLWAGGREERQTVRQPERKKREAERQRERAAGRETRREKKVVGSQLLLHDDLLSRHAVTDTHKQHLPLLDYMPMQCKESCTGIIQMTRKCQSSWHFYTLCKTETHTNSLVMGCSCLCEPLLLLFLSSPACVVWSLSVCQSACCSFICFVLLSVVS